MAVWLPIAVSIAQIAAARSTSGVTECGTPSMTMTAVGLTCSNPIVRGTTETYLNVEQQRYFCVQSDLSGYRCCVTIATTYDQLPENVRQNGDLYIPTVGPDLLHPFNLNTEKWQAHCSSCGEYVDDAVDIPAIDFLCDHCLDDDKGDDGRLVTRIRSVIRRDVRSPDVD